MKHLILLGATMLCTPSMAGVLTHSDPGDTTGFSAFDPYIGFGNGPDAAHQTTLDMGFGLLSGDQFIIKADGDSSTSGPFAGLDPSIDGNAFISGWTSISLAFAKPVYQFSIILGSIDNYNSLNFGGFNVSGSTLASWVTSLGSISQEVTYRSNTPFSTFSATSGGIPAVEMEWAAPSTSPVPEPSTWAMLLCGFLGLAYTTMRKARTARSII